MTPKVLRLIGIVFLVTAVVLAVLNLKRVADLGMPWAGPMFIVFGAVCMALARRSRP